MGRVLIADDDPETRELLKYKLQQSYDVTDVDRGDACWEYLQEHTDEPPDLVILDVMMPGLDGFRVLDRITSDDRFEDLPVVMLTSRGKEADVVDALEKGATDYLTKPFPPNELVARIGQILE